METGAPVRRRRWWLLAVLLGAAATPAGAQTSPSDRVGAGECCLPLLLHVSARAVALGNAVTARAGADAVFVNPAALAGLDRDEFRVHSSETDIEDATALGLAFSIREAGTVGVNYHLLDYGEIEATDEFGNPVGTLRLLKHELLASFATTLGPGLAAGVTYRLYQDRQDCRGSCTSSSATTHALDLGVRYHPAVWPQLQLGAALVHLGPALQVINAEQADPTPVRVRAGAAYELSDLVTPDSTVQLWGSVDVSGSWRDGVKPVAAGGLELILDRTIFVRAGYSTGSGRNAGAAVGVGLRYDRFDVGVARGFAPGAAGGRDPYHVTFAIGF